MVLTNSNLSKIFVLVSKSNIQEQLSGRIAVETPIILRAMRDEEFRSRLILNPKTTLEEEFSSLLGKKVEFPNDFNITILEETDSAAFIVLPRIPKEGELPVPADLDPDGGVAHYCTTVGCKPGYSC